MTQDQQTAQTMSPLDALRWHVEMGLDEVVDEVAEEVCGMLEREDLGALPIGVRDDLLFPVRAGRTHRLDQVVAHTFIVLAPVGHLLDDVVPLAALGELLAPLDEVGLSRLVTQGVFVGQCLVVGFQTPSMVSQVAVSRPFPAAPAIARPFALHAASRWRQSQ